MAALAGLAAAAVAPGPLAGLAAGFVLSPANLTLSSGLPGSAYRWTTPASSESADGLGKGLAYVLDPSFCSQMVPLFPENDGMFGLVTFVDCTELKAAIGRAMATWSDNHAYITFSDISDTSKCANAITGALNDPCPWEIYITSASGDTNSALAAYVVSSRASSFDTTPPWYQRSVRSPAGVEQLAVDQFQRSNVTIQRHICWYIDPTFCATFSSMGDTGKVLLRVALFTVFAFAIIRIFFIVLAVCFCLCCVRKLDLRESSVHNTRLVCQILPYNWGYSECADYLSQLSPCGLFLTILCAVFPLIFYDRIYLPCEECYDFESVVAHEIGHVLGFGHPNEDPTINLAATTGCLINNATCRDPFSCAKTSEYSSSVVSSIMHSITRVSPETCLYQQDLEGLHMLYPVCDDSMPKAPLCDKSMRLSGWLRLAIVIGVPVALSLLLIMVPITCFHNRDRRLLDRLADEMENVDEDEKEEEKLLKLKSILMRHKLQGGTSAQQSQSALMGAMNRSLARLPLRNEEPGQSPGQSQQQGQPSESREDARSASSVAKGNQVVPVLRSTLSGDMTLEDVSANNDEPGFALHKPQSEDENSIPSQIREVLKNADARQVLRTFAQKEQREDLVLFWEEVEAFRRRWDGYGSGDKADSMRENDAEEVIIHFLNDGSPHQVCEGDSRVKALVDSSHTGKNMFDELQDVVYQKMQSELFPRFSSSPEGKDLARKDGLVGSGI